MKSGALLTAASGAVAAGVAAIAVTRASARVPRPPAQRVFVLAKCSNGDPLRHAVASVNTGVAVYATPIRGDKYDLLYVLEDQDLLRAMTIAVSAEQLLGAKPVMRLIDDLRDQQLPRPLIGYGDGLVSWFAIHTNRGCGMAALSHARSLPQAVFATKVAGNNPGVLALIKARNVDEMFGTILTLLADWRNIRSIDYIGA